MKAIIVKDLSKTFTVKTKEKGFKGTLKSMVKPDYRKVEAVKGIFCVSVSCTSPVPGGKSISK